MICPSDNLVPWMVCAVLVGVATAVAVLAWVGKWRATEGFVRALNEYNVWHRGELDRLQRALVISHCGLGELGDYNHNRNLAEQACKDLGVE